MGYFRYVEYKNKPRLNFVVLGNFYKVIFIFLFFFLFITVILSLFLVIIVHNNSHWSFTVNN